MTNDVYGTFQNDGDNDDDDDDNNDDDDDDYDDEDKELITCPFEINYSSAQFCNA